MAFPSSLPAQDSAGRLRYPRKRRGAVSDRVRLGDRGDRVGRSKRGDPGAGPSAPVDTWSPTSSTQSTSGPAERLAGALDRAPRQGRRLEQRTALSRWRGRSSASAATSTAIGWPSFRAGTRSTFATAHRSSCARGCSTTWPGTRGSARAANARSATSNAAARPRASRTSCAPSAARCSTVAGTPPAAATEPERRLGPV
jgi:hypothetical protein